MTLLLLPPRRRPLLSATGVGDPPEPRDARAGPAASQRPTRRAAGATKPPSILIVDDDPLMTDLLPRRLKRALLPELRILTASTPEEGIRIARDEQPDVILSDYNLRASLTGLDVLQEASEVAPEATRILFSAHTRSEIGSALATAPIHGFIEKTMRLDDIIRPLVDLVLETRGLDLERGSG